MNYFDDNYARSKEYTCKCGHTWKRHYGLGFTNRCREEGCKCKDFDCREEAK